jgi:hypothetical protein
MIAKKDWTKFPHKVSETHEMKNGSGKSGFRAIREEMPGFSSALSAELQPERERRSPDKY